MKRADVEPYYGAAVAMTVSIPNLDDTLYVGRLVPFTGGSRTLLGGKRAAGAGAEPRVALQPLESVPARYRQRATNGLALCPISAIVSMERVD
jgi:hypothetical protein